MAEFSMNESGEIIKDPATKEDLARWGNEYLKKYFSDGPEHDIEIGFTSEPGHGGCFIPANGLVLIPQTLAPYEKACRILLLHEMVHIGLFLKYNDPDAGHKERFKGEISRLFGCGAYGNLL